MDTQRIQRHLETLFQGRSVPMAKELVPLISRWNELLGAIPGLQKRHAAAHCRIAGLSAGLLLLEADHPAWLQLLQWHEDDLLDRLGVAFPTYRIRGLQFRLTRAGDAVERPTSVMPEPTKVDLSPEERVQMENLLAELGSLVQKSTEAKKPG